MHVRAIADASIGALVAPEFHSKPWYHFSIDDVFDSLIEISRNGTPMFDHPFFRLLAEIHEYSNAQIDLELFYEKEIDGRSCTLADIRDLRDEISAHGSWLRFGPHARSYLVAPFEQSPQEQQDDFDRIYAEIDRFAGSRYYAQWVRLHFYSESFELGDYFKSKGVTALFSTDRPVGCHRMPEVVGKSLLDDGFATYNNTNFIRTQYRVEEFTNSRVTEEDLRAMFLHSLKQYGFIVFYSHEYEFARSEVRNMLRKTFTVLRELGVVSVQQSYGK